MGGPLSFFSGAVFVPAIRAEPSEIRDTRRSPLLGGKTQAGYDRASPGPLEYDLIKHHLSFVIPNEVRDLQFAVEENHASSSTLRNNSVSHLILGGAALQRCGKTYPLLHEREGHGFKAGHPGPKKKRALAPEGLGRLPLKPLEKRICHPERSEGSAVRRRGEPCFVRHAAEQL